MNNKEIEEIVEIEEIEENHGHRFIGCTVSRVCRAFLFVFGLLPRVSGKRRESAAGACTARDFNLHR